MPSNNIIPNSGKRFFLMLISNAVYHVNATHNEFSLTYARKEMIKRGLDKYPNMLRKIRKLFSHLQDIVSSYSENFEGLNPELGHKN